MSTEVVFSQIRKAYQPERPVLRPLDLRIAAGELFFLLGLLEMLMEQGDDFPGFV